MRHLLVPLDGSTFGEHALQPAVMIAARTGATLHLVHVFDAPILPFSFEGAAPFETGWSERARAESRGYLEELAARHAAPAGVHATVRLLESPIVEALAEYAHGHDIDLVVMTTHGRGGLSRTWLGSVADELLRQVHVPVLLLRPDADADAIPAARPLRHVLVPLDGSPLAEAALEPAGAMAALSGADLMLVHVVPPMFMAGLPYAPTAATFDAEAYRLQRWRAERYLTHMTQRVRPMADEVRTLLVTHGQPAIAIAEAAREHDIDLIVVATHGRGGVARWALGSVTDKLIRSGVAPLLVVPPGSAAKLSAWRPAEKRQVAPRPGRRAQRRPIETG